MSKKRGRRSQGNNLEYLYSFLCDFADNSGAKLTAVGIGFDTIYARSVPATHLSLYSVLSLRFSSVETGSKQISLVLVDADGNLLGAQVDGAIQVNTPSPGYTYRTARIVMALFNIRFSSFGDYAVVWTVDGHEVARNPVKVAEPPPSPTTA